MKNRNKKITEVNEDKNEDKPLHLKENVEKNTKTRSKEHRRLETQHDGFQKEAELLFKKQPR